MADSTEYLREIARNTSYLTSGNSSTSQSLNVISIVPNIRNIILTNSNAEYVQSFTNTRLIEIFCRSLVELKYAFRLGDINEGKYRTIPSGVSQPINFPTGYKWSGNLYISSTTPNAIVEIETWG